MCKLQGKNPFVLCLFLLVSWSACLPTPQPTSLSLTQLRESQANIRRLFGQLHSAADEAHLKYAKAHQFYPGDSPIPPYPYILSFFLPSTATPLPQTFAQLISQWARQNASARLQLCIDTLASFNAPMRQIRRYESQQLGKTANSTVAVRMLEEKFLRQTISALQHVANQVGMAVTLSPTTVDLTAMKEVVRGIRTRNDFTQWTARTLMNYGILEALRDLVQRLNQQSICQIQHDDLKTPPS